MRASPTTDPGADPRVDDSSGGGGEILRFGAFELDLAREELRRGGVLVRLAPQPFRLLAFLAARSGELVPREAIRDHLWEPGLHLEFDQGINALVREVRRALGDDAGAPRFLATVPRRGYRFVAPVERRTAAAASVVEAAAAEVAPATSPSGRRRRRRRAAAMAAAVLGAAVVAALLLVAPGSRAAVTLAVLPFEEVGGGEADAVAAGLNEELITLLGRRFRGELQVIAPTSALAFRRSGRDPRAFASELGAEYVLAGTIRRQDGELRISARLASAEDAAILWAATYERAADDLLGFEERLAASIAEALALNILPQQPSPGTASPKAHVAYLRGHDLLREQTPRGGETQRAQAEFRKAVEIDPGFAAAWAGLARATGRLHGWEAVDEVSRYLDRALALDDQLAEAHLLRGKSAFYRRLDFARARTSFERALEINPSFAEAHHALTAWYSARNRHDEALASLARATELDPLAPNVRSDACWFPYFAGDWQDALLGAERTLALDPGYSFAIECRTVARLASGDLAAALAAAAGEIEATHHRLDELLAADTAEASAVAAAARRFAEAHAAGAHGAAVAAFWRWRLAIADLVALHPWGVVTPEERAVAHAALGEKEAALDLLEQALVGRRGWRLPFLAVDPEFDPLRDEPRFQALQAKVLGEP